MRGLKEHDTTETIAEDNRPFIIYESLESRLHVGLRANGIARTAQSKLSRFSACSGSQPKQSDAAGSTSPIRPHSSTASNGLVYFEKSSPLFQLGEAEVKFPHLFVNLGLVKCFNEKAQNWQITHYALVMDLDSSDDEVDPRYQSRAAGTLPLLKKAFSFALLKQEKVTDKGYVTSDNTESLYTPKSASLTQTIPIGPRQSGVHQRQKRKGRRARKAKVQEEC